MTDITNKIIHFFCNERNDAERIFHGRGQVFPGFEHVTIDHYPPAVLITFFEHRANEAELIKSTVEALDIKHVKAVVIQRRYLPKSPSEIHYGELPHDHVVTENGIKYSVTLGKTQNSGLFLDMVSGRDWLRNNAKGKRVLNLFSFTCSISVAALAGGAEHVVNFDMAKGALNTGRLNHRINDINMNRVEFFAHDILKSWGKIKKKGPFDIVVIDPPSFQKGSFVATKDYTKVIRRLPEFINPGGLVLAALNSPELDTAFIKGIFKKECPQSRFIKRIENPAAFPDTNPECSLKLMLFSTKQNSRPPDIRNQQMS